MGPPPDTAIQRRSSPGNTTASSASLRRGLASVKHASPGIAGLGHVTTRYSQCHRHQHSRAAHRPAQNLVPAEVVPHLPPLANMRRLAGSPPGLSAKPRLSPVALIGESFAFACPLDGSRGNAGPVTFAGQTSVVGTFGETAGFACRPPVLLRKTGGGERVRTDDLRLAKPALSQLSYTPVQGSSIRDQGSGISDQNCGGKARASPDTRRRLRHRF